MNSSKNIYKRNQIERQINHWITATKRFENLDSWASDISWKGLERYLGLTLRKSFSESIIKLKNKIFELKSILNNSNSEEDNELLRKKLILFRIEYTQVEIMLDFFGDAINTRTSDNISALLRACDKLVEKSLTDLLQQFNKPIPPVLTYLDKGLGASILKHGLRLWDGITLNPVATIKIVRHNLLRPTSLIHEAGHQAAHQLNWNDELASELSNGLRDSNLSIRNTWSSWASEIAADVFAFVYTGFASVAALHDVIAGDEDSIFRFRLFDPHPINFLRVLLCVEFCKLCYGKGIWDDLSLAWTESNQIDNAKTDTKDLVTNSIPLLTSIAEICLKKTLKALNNKSIIQCVDPNKVSPSKLAEMEKINGNALYKSTHLVNTELLRITALTGFRSAEKPSESEKYWKQQEEFMILLGNTNK